MSRPGTYVRRDGVQWLTDQLGRLIGYLDDTSTEVLGGLVGRLQVFGSLVYAGAVVASGGNVPVPGATVTLPAGWLLTGDGLDVELHYELGGTDATLRQLNVQIQPVADYGTLNNLQTLVSIGNSDGTPKDGSGLWVATLLTGGLKRSAIGSPTGVGLNSSSFAVAPFSTTTAYNIYASVGQISAANSITVYRLTVERKRA